jgi:FkbM family methyltransferase
MEHIPIHADDAFSFLLISNAKWIYIGYRLVLRIFMGKNRRNDYLKTNPVHLGDFIPLEKLIKANGIKAIPRKHTADFEMLFVDREAELQPHLFMNRDETFIDIGANVGHYTLKAATLYGNSIKVVSIEAHPENYRTLRRNIECNQFNNIVYVINKAVSDKKASVTLYERITHNNHLSTDDYTLLEKENSKSSIQVESDTIDNILKENNIKKADVLKMDIEGAEVLALKGATETLKKLRKIIVEIHGNTIEEVKSILLNNKFNVQILNTRGMWDFCFIIGHKLTDDL